MHRQCFSSRVMMHFRGNKVVLGSKQYPSLTAFLVTSEDIIGRREDLCIEDIRFQPSFRADENV